MGKKCAKLGNWLNADDISKYLGTKNTRRIIIHSKRNLNLQERVTCNKRLYRCVGRPLGLHTRVLNLTVCQIYYFFHKTNLFLV